MSEWMIKRWIIEKTILDPEYLHRPTRPKRRWEMWIQNVISVLDFNIDISIYRREYVCPSLPLSLSIYIYIHITLDTHTVTNIWSSYILKLCLKLLGHFENRHKPALVVLSYCDDMKGPPSNLSKFFMNRWSVFHYSIHSGVFTMDRQFCRRLIDWCVDLHSNIKFSVPTSSHKALISDWSRSEYCRR